MSVSKPLEDIILSSDPAHAMIFLGDQKTGRSMIRRVKLGHGKCNAKTRPVLLYDQNLLKGSHIYFQIKGINPRKGLEHGHKNISHTAEALWDDGTIMKLSFEGRSKDHFKTITSFSKNNILGTLFEKDLASTLSRKFSIVT